MIRKINVFATAVVLFLLMITGISCDKVNVEVPPVPVGGLAITATLNKSQTTSHASGSLVGHFDKSTSILDFTVDWANLSNVPTGMQLKEGSKTPLSIGGFSSSRNGTLYSSVSLPGNAAADLLSGNVSFIISTVTYPAGELSGQIIAK